jgi:hypothetical protein
LTPHRLRELDPCDLRDRIPQVGRLERAGEQHVLAHRLRGQLRIDAGGVEKKQLADACGVRPTNEIELDRQIVGQELDGIRVVIRDPADARGRNHDHIGPRLGEPAFGLRLSRQLENAPVRRQDGAVLRLEPPRDRPTDHAPVASHVNVRSLRSNSAAFLSAADAIVLFTGRLDIFPQS